MLNVIHLHVENSLYVRTQGLGDGDLGSYHVAVCMKGRVYRYHIIRVIIVGDREWGGGNEGRACFWGVGDIVDIILVSCILRHINRSQLVHT